MIDRALSNLGVAQSLRLQLPQLQLHKNLARHLCNIWQKVLFVFKMNSTNRRPKSSEGLFSFIIVRGNNIKFLEYNLVVKFMIC